MASAQCQYPEASISKQILGDKKAEDLISSIYLDHEQAQRTPALGRSASQAAASPTTNYPSPTFSSTQSLPASKHSAPPSETNSLNADQLRARSVSVPLSVIQFQRSHFKPIGQTSKCFDQNCRKKFAMLEKPRNCSMCGEVFCKRCTNYRRKLSVSANPDPFGNFYNVCCKCFNHHPVSGAELDHMRDFSSIRRAKLEKEMVEARNTICGGRNSSSKRKAMMKEIDRLKKGFAENAGFIKGFMSEMKIPDWQKSSNWVDSRNASACYECKSSFSRISRKIHCRIGGQVFCTKCAKDEIVIYLDEREGEPKWGVNGKSGGPIATPVRFEMYPVCSSCSSELQSILLENLSSRSSCNDNSDFMNSIKKLHESLSKLQRNVDAWLPQYEQVVDALDIVDNSPRNVEEKHPLRKLAKAQSDLSDALTVLAVESQKLKLLRPESPIQERLLRHMMIGTYQFYQEHMYHFRCTRQRLAEHMPYEHLVEIQKVLSQQSMERVHIVIQQIMYEALNLEHRYKFDSKFLEDVVESVHSIEDEFRPFLEERGESWEQHSEVVKLFIKQAIESKRLLIKLNRETCTDPKIVRYVVISQCSTRIQELCREIQAKTMDREFRKTKKSLNDARLNLDAALITAQYFYAT